MRILGVVSEYNPFHKGHQYLLRESRRILGGDALVVCAMSGDFVQRGEAACFDKFARAEAAVFGGADLVAELPLPWCLSSAEGFARGAVAILSALGCTDLAFGSECGDLEALARTAAALDDPETKVEIDRLLSADASLSYARARQEALSRCNGEDARLLGEPNNILALEYLRAIRSQGCAMKPLTLKRIGAAHDETASDGAFPSAMRLRAMLREGREVDAYVPDACMAVYRREAEKGRAANPPVMERLLLSRLYALDAACFDLLPDAGDGAGRRLKNALAEGKGLEETAILAASKRHTRARMRRMLLCAALGVQSGEADGFPPYVRLLAMNERGRAFLHEHAKQADLPILTRPASVRELGSRAERVFSAGASAHDLYCLQMMTSSDICMSEDWKTGPALVKNL